MMGPKNRAGAVAIGATSALFGALIFDDAAYPDRCIDECRPDVQQLELAVGMIAFGAITIALNSLLYLGERSAPAKARDTAKPTSISRTTP